MIIQQVGRKFMAVNIYLALYKGNSTTKIEHIQDKLIRFFTKGIYSHCEIVVHKQECWERYDYRDVYECYTSSPRDSGVRCKQIDINDGKWDLIHLDNITEEQVKAYFEKTKGAKYDWRGVFGLVLGFREKKSKFFCSEWCFNLIFNSSEGWRFNPNQLAVILRTKGENKM